MCIGIKRSIKSCWKIQLQLLLNDWSKSKQTLNSFNVFTLCDQPMLHTSASPHRMTRIVVIGVVLQSLSNALSALKLRYRVCFHKFIQRYERTLVHADSLSDSQDKIRGENVIRQLTYPIIVTVVSLGTLSNKIIIIHQNWGTVKGMFQFTTPTLVNSPSLTLLD